MSIHERWKIRLGDLERTEILFATSANSRNVGIFDPAQKTITIVDIESGKKTSSAVNGDFSEAVEFVFNTDDRSIILYSSSTGTAQLGNQLLFSGRRNMCNLKMTKSGVPAIFLVEQSQSSFSLVRFNLVSRTFDMEVDLTRVFEDHFAKKPRLGSIPCFSIQSEPVIGWEGKVFAVDLNDDTMLWKLSFPNVLRVNLRECVGEHLVVNCKSTSDVQLISSKDGSVKASAKTPPGEVIGLSPGRKIVSVADCAIGMPTEVRITDWESKLVTSKVIPELISDVKTSCILTLDGKYLLALEASGYLRCYSIDDF